MGLDIGTLTGRIELQDGMSSALMLMRGKVGSVETAFNNLDTSAKSLGLAIAATGVAIVGTVVGIGAAVVKLGTDGSRIKGIEDAFNNLAKAAGTTSEALVGPLSAALKSTVHEGDLMAMLNKSLGAGVRLTAADMTVLGETARAMGKAFGTDASQGLETLNSALTSGNTRSLKRMGIIVDMAAAEKKFAASIGSTADQLNAAGKLEAKRLGMLDAMRDRVSKMGVSEMSLAEKISAGKVAVEEWFEKLSLAVEKSSAVHGAFDKIRASIEKAFGASSQALLNKVVEWINRFAYAVGEYGPKIIQAIVDIKDWIVKVWDAVEATWDRVPDWFKRIAFDAGLAAVAIGGTSIAVQGITGTDILGVLANFAQIWSVIGINVGKATVALKEWMLLISAFGWEAVGLAIKTALAPLVALAVANPFTAVAIAVTALSVALRELAGISFSNQFKFMMDWILEGPGVAGAKMMGRKAMEDAANTPGAAVTGQMPGYMTSSWMQPTTTKTPSMMARPQSIGSALANEFSLGYVAKPFDDNSKFIKSGLADLQAAMDAMSGQQLIKETDNLTEAYVGLAARGLKPSMEALTSYRDALRKVMDIYATMPEKKIAGISISGSNFPLEAVKRLEEINAEIDRIIYKKNWSEGISAGLQAISKEAAETRVRVKGIADMLTVDPAIAASRDMSAALSKVVGVSGDYSKLLVSQLRPALDAVTAGIKAMRAEGEQIPPDMLEQQFQLSSLVAQYKFAALSITTTLAPATEYYTDALGVQIPVIGGVHDAMGNLIGVNLRADGSFDALNVVLDTSTEKIGDVASVLLVLGKVFDDINSRMGQAAQVASKAWEIIGDKTTKRNPKFGQPGEPAEIATFSASQKWVAGLGAAAEATNLFVTGAGRAASAARGMVTGLASGAAIGTMIMPGIGTAIGAVGGAIAGLVSGWNSAGKAAREANREADKTLTQLRAGLVTTYGSIANVSMIGKVLGVDLAAAWGDTTVAGLEHFSKMVDEFEKKLQGLQSTLQKYGLTWIDMGGDIQRFFATKIGGDLVEEFNSMVGAGIDVNKVIKSMSASLNQYIIDSVKAGTKVPAEMEPIITKMIELGLVTDDAAKAMLGLGADAMPTLADITAAAERYGLSLDALGPKVKQLSINEAAAQIASDWAILTAAGVDIGVILSSMNPEVKGMGEQVQELVSQAMQYGLELPSSMRPILQAMIDAGTLTDDTGKKLEDLSGLTFAVDLTKMFEDLMKALKDLITTISGDVVPAITDIGNARIPPIRIPYYYDDEGGGHSGRYGEDNSGSGGVGMVGGGIVRPLYLAGGWAPMGSDTVPAMLTPGESVLTVAQTRAAGHTGGGTVIVKIDRRTLAEILVPVLPGVVREYSLG